MFEGLLVPFDFAEVVYFKIHWSLLADFKFDYQGVGQDVPHFLLRRLNAGIVAGKA
jgi:hypothetical protein